MNDQQLQKLKSLISQNLGISESQVQLASDLSADLGADSLDALHLLVMVNQEFSVNIKPEDVDLITTVADLVQLIDESAE